MVWGVLLTPTSGEPESCGRDDRFLFLSNLFLHLFLSKNCSLGWKIPFKEEQIKSY